MHNNFQNHRHIVDQKESFHGPKTQKNAPITVIPPENGPVHVECSTMRNIMASATEEELLGFFEKCQAATSTRTALTEMGHPKTPTPVEKYNTV